MSTVTHLAPSIGTLRVAPAGIFPFLWMVTIMRGSGVTIQRLGSIVVLLLCRTQAARRNLLQPTGGFMNREDTKASLHCKAHYLFQQLRSAAKG